MRRSVIALIGLAIIGCSSGGPITSPPPAHVVIDDLAPLIVANGSTISPYVDGKAETLHQLDEGDAALALSGPDAEGIVVQQRIDGRSNIIRVVDGETETIAESAGLLEAALVDDSPTIVYATCNEAPGEERQGDIVLFDVASRDKRALADACAIEYGVSRVSFGGSVFVVSATSDLTEVFQFYEPDGTLIEDRPDPTKDLPYNEPPFMSDAVLSADGSSLAYLEAPDVSGVTGAEQKRSGRFNVVVIHQRTGKETVRVAIPDPATQYQRLDYDGRWIVLSQAGEPVSVVDTDADEPEAIDIGVEGIASIVRR